MWQMFTGCGFSEYDTGSSCVAAFTAACKPDSREQTRMCYFDLKMRNQDEPGSFVDPASDVAASLAVLFVSRFRWFHCDCNF